MAKVYPRSAKQVLKQINCPHLALYRGEGYWYFSYDTLDAGGIYETKSEAVCYLSHMSLDLWVSAGQQFVDDCKRQEAEQKESQA